MSTTAINNQLREEYERMLISMLLGSENRYRKEHIISHLNKDMFSQKLYRDCFMVIDEIHRSGKDIDITAFCENSGQETQRLLALELNKEFITDANCDFYIRKVQDFYIEKLAIECKSLESFHKIEALKNKYALKKNVFHISEGAEKLIPRYYENWETAVKTGYPSIDEKLGSLLGGDLLILAGAPGMGKTCMMLNLLIRAAKNGKHVLLFSLEMKLPQLQNRIISPSVNISSDKIRKFNMSDDEVYKYSEFAESDYFKNLNIVVCDDFNMTMNKIRLTVFQINPDLVIIDYLGLIKGEKSNQYESISEISRQLKVLAGDCNKPLIVLHQLSRANTERKDKRPQLSDLRGSGQIEQDADFVCFVYRQDYYSGRGANYEELEFLIAKSRHSAGRACIKLCYDGGRQLITEGAKGACSKEGSV